MDKHAKHYKERVHFTRASLVLAATLVFVIGSGTDLRVANAQSEEDLASQAYAEWLFGGKRPSVYSSALEPSNTNRCVTNKPPEKRFKRLINQERIAIGKNRLRSTPS